MARALRIELAGAWHHVMNRGHRGGVLFLSDTEWLRGCGGKEWGGERHRDWGRDAAMHVAERHGALRLVEVVRELNGPRDQAAAQAVRRLAASLDADAARRKFFVDELRQLSII